MKKYNIKINSEILEDVETSISAKWLYAVMLVESEIKRSKEFFLSTESLIEKSGLSHNTVDKARKELISKGYIKKQLKPLDIDGSKTTTHYCFYTILK